MTNDQDSQFFDGKPKMIGAPPHGTKSAEERFNTRDVIDVVGIDAGKLQNWLTRGAVQLEEGQNPGRGKSREYTTYEVARIRLMRKLVDLSVPLAAAFKITADLKKLWQAVPGGHESYAAEPGLRSYLIVVRADAAAALGKRAMSTGGDYVCIWLVENLDRADRKSESLISTLDLLGDDPVMVLNMGAFLAKTVAMLSARRNKSGCPAE